MSIPFTQYMLPSGRRVQVEFDAEPEVEAVALRFIARGGYFEAEVLTTGGRIRRF